MTSPLPGLVLMGARDWLRRPVEGALLAAALAATTLLCATALLLVRAVGDTADAALERGPALVVRRLDARGFAPLPVAEALAAARRIPGVTSARARTWGTVSGPDGAVTVLAVDDAIATRLLALGLPSPMRGDVLAGPGIAPGRSLALRGAASLGVTIVGQLPAELASVGGDTLLAEPADARALLGVAAGEASDLALDVFHEAEAAALSGELAAAFPWPVRIVTRREMRGVYATELGKRGGLAAFAAAPAILSLVVLVASAVRDRLARRREVGLLKALGWTTGDVVTLQLARALVVALPATAIGLALATAVVLWPGAVWPGPLLLGWTAAPAHLVPRVGGAIAVLVETSALVLVPWLAATLAPTIAGATTDPGAMLAEDA
jgi:hypothetical protein